MNHFAVHLKLAQHCKSTILQFKKKTLKAARGSGGGRHITLREAIISITADFSFKKKKQVKTHCSNKSTEKI